MTLFDGQEQYPVSTIIGKKYAVPENFGRVLNFDRDGIEHHLFYTQSSYGRDMTQEEAKVFYKQAKKVLEEVQPDVVLTYGSSQLSRALIREARKNCKTLIFYLANPSYEDPELFQAVDQVLVPSNFQREYYQERLGIQSHVLRTLLPESSQIGPEDTLASQCPERRRLGFVTMINPSLPKGATLFARLVRMARQERPELLFLAVEGRMTHEQWAQAGMDLANMPNIWWIPNQQDVRTIYARTSVLLFPSFWNEASGRSIAEAQLGGIPVLGSNHAGIPEQLNGGGFLFDIPSRCKERYTKVPGKQEVRPWLDTIYQLMDDQEFYSQAVRKALECGAMFDRKLVEQDVLQRFQAYAEGKDLQPPLQAQQKLKVWAPLIKPAKIGRNDPCPCGSGRKVKKCCGVEAASQALQQQADECGFQEEAEEQGSQSKYTALTDPELEFSIGQQQERSSALDEIQDASWRDLDLPKQEWLLELEPGLRISLPADLSVLSSYVLLEQEKWLEPETEFVASFLSPGMRVLDIGASFGAYALPMALAVGQEGEVLAFEPCRQARAYLEASKQVNSLDGLHILPQALAASQGRGRLLESETPEQNRLEDTRSGYPGQEVEMISLDSWWQEAGWPQLDLVKLDVNGLEPKVLQGGAECLSCTKPLILTCIRENGALNRSTLQALEHLGYELYQYLPVPGLLIKFNQDAAPEPYILNLVAVSPDQVEDLQAQGWIITRELDVPEPEDGYWQMYLGELPWSAGWVPFWRERAASGQQEYLQALDFLCAAQESRLQAAHRLALIQCAAQSLVRIYKDQRTAPVALTLARAMHDLGLRQQAVQVLDMLLLELSAHQELDSGLPFLPPLGEFDWLKLQSSMQDWILARCKESLVLLRSFSGYFRPKQDLELLQGLEANQERSVQAERWKMLCALRSGLSKNLTLDSYLLAPQLKNSQIWAELTLGPSGHGAQSLEMKRQKGPEQSRGMDSQDVDRRPAKVRRNDPCPCGSGKKAKNCCGTRRAAGSSVESAVES
jgi:FkbM family methyltransferase